MGFLGMGLWDLQGRSVNTQEGEALPAMDDHEIVATTATVSVFRLPLHRLEFPTAASVCYLLFAISRDRHLPYMGFHCGIHVYSLTTIVIIVSTTTPPSLYHCRTQFNICKGRILTGAQIRDGCGRY
ncbi:hypothetical protein KSS87_015730 [Heliosperma pusillum]|nr:hypothetical protein KSS87_015730 [Heliosperma pusillum]